MVEHCFIVSYDLCQPGRDYSNLISAIKSFPSWGKLTESTWAVVSDKTASEICSFLINYIDSNDRLIVVVSGKSASWIRMLADNDWIKQHIVK